MSVWVVLIMDYADDTVKDMVIFDSSEKAEEYVKSNWHKWEDDSKFNYVTYKRNVG